MLSYRRMTWLASCIQCLVVLLLVRRPPITTRTDPLFPYLPLFRCTAARPPVPRRAAAPWRRRPPARAHGAPHRLRWLVVVGADARAGRTVRTAAGRADRAVAGR